MKKVFVCGDFNVDLLNPNEGKENKDFIDTMYSIGLVPTILKLTRITNNSATLIDNFFTNELGSRIISGLLLNDVSDLLPVFPTFQSFTMIKSNINIENNNNHKLNKKRTPEALKALKYDLRKQCWNVVYSKK